MADDHEFEVKYVGPFTEGVEENYQVVKPGEKIKVDEHRAAHLTEGDAWEVVGSRKPRRAKAGDQAAVVVAAGDVHATPAAAAADAADVHQDTAETHKGEG